MNESMCKSRKWIVSSAIAAGVTVGAAGIAAVADKGQRRGVGSGSRRNGVE